MAKLTSILLDRVSEALGHRGWGDESGGSQIVFKLFIMQGRESFQRKWLLKFSKECPRCTTRNDIHMRDHHKSRLVCWEHLCTDGCR